MGEQKLYEAITDEERLEIEESLVETVNDKFRKEELSENFFKYIVELHTSKFVALMTVDEIKESARLTVDILEELKNINNSGVNREKFKKIEKENETKYAHIDVLFPILGIWNYIRTERLEALMCDLDRVRRVGGAYARLIANPGLVSSICAVYERLVDAFEDEKLYDDSAYFLMRSIMRMHSNEIEDKEKMLEHYMNLNYVMSVIKDDEGMYTAYFQDLPGCITCGETPEELFKNAEDAKRCWFKSCIEEGGKDFRTIRADISEET
ncbi:MAG: type II toxin-antitoxin system HicB family antitoxin [Lachnospiraceae bacterium]|jgi:predicted RNase H-like HicB family nuclease|nr:type II toxin-antitoxin system HicB family antitoxin [Lachnospiraceae bacterium]